MSGRYRSRNQSSNEVVVFDLRRINTVVSLTDKVHIVAPGGFLTLCRRAILAVWSENLGDRQPQCIVCRRLAYGDPIQYPFTKYISPPSMGPLVYKCGECVPVAEFATPFEWNQHIQRFHGGASTRP